MKLTRRQTQVIVCAAGGMTMQTTAKVLGISLETVKMHRKYTLRALRAKNFTHAVAIAIRAGVLEDPRAQI